MAFPTIFLSQVVVSGIPSPTFNQQFSQALATIAGAGGGKIIIDYSAANVSRITLNSNHSNLTIGGVDRRISIEAASAQVQLYNITSASDVTIENLTLVGNGEAGFQTVKTTGQRTVLRNLDISTANTSLQGGSFCVNVTAGAQGCVLENLNLHDANNGIRVGDGAKVTRIVGGTISNCQQRGILVTGGRADPVEQTEHVQILGTFFGDQVANSSASDSGCQPIRCERGAPTNLAPRHIQIDSVQIVDAVSQAGSSDSISFNGPTNFVVSNCLVDRKSDGGIVVATGSKNGLIVGNIIRNTDAAGIGIGANPDISGGTLNENIAIAGNSCIDTGRDELNEHLTNAPYRVVYGSQVSLVGNSYRTSGSNIPGYILFARGSTNLSWLNNTGDRRYQTALIGIDDGSQGGVTPPTTTTFAAIDGAFAGEPPMQTSAPTALPGSMIYDTVASTAKAWTGASWANL